MTQFLLSVLEISLSMSAVLVLILLLSVLFGKRFTAKCRYIIWTLVMLRLAIPFGAPFLPALFNVDIPAEFTRTNEGKTTGGVGLGQSSGVADNYVNTQNVSTSVMPAETNPVSAPISDNAPVAPSVTDIFSVAAYIYFAAASLLFAVKLIQYAAFTFKINMGKRNADEHVYKIYGKLCEKYKIRRAPVGFEMSDIYFNKYTGDIFGDAVGVLSFICIRPGVVDLTPIYWYGWETLK